MDGAIAEFREAQRLGPGNEVIGINLGNALEGKGDLDGALAAFQQLAHERPRLALVHFRIGQILEKKGEPRKARNQFRQAVELAPNNPQFQAALDRARDN